MRKQRGFTLITAIFLLVVVAGLVAYFTNLRVVQQVSLVYGVQGARALQAAQTGMEWGICEALGGSCSSTATTVTVADVELSQFTISVTCNVTNHEEFPDPPIPVYQIESTATAGTYPSLDYVQRIISTSVSISPP